MAFFLEHVVVFLLTITLCMATLQSVLTRFTEKKSVATSHTILKSVSKVQCVEKCNKERQKGRCTLAGYNKATKTCFLSVDDPQDVVDTTNDMAGVFFYTPDLTGMLSYIYQIYFSLKTSYNSHFLCTNMFYASQTVL